MVSHVRGDFTKTTGTINYDSANPSASSVEASIDLSSIHTRDEQRDAHLKSADFFDVEKFPTMTFKSTSVTASGNGGIVTGDLTLHGVTLPITFEVEGPAPEIKDPWGMHRIGGTVTGKLNRKDFGLTYNAALEAGGVVIGDEVKITIEFEAVR
jgi:polyisoprenoid-binding protein YceI